VIAAADMRVDWHDWTANETVSNAKTNVLYLNDFNMLWIFPVIGQRFSRLVVLEFVGKSTDHRLLWRCRCDCGNEAIVLGSDLRRQSTRSCGCLRREIAIEKAKQKAQIAKTHGHACRNAHSPEYGVWTSMKERCSAPNSKDWPRYGGRGIKVCDEWINDFERFFRDMGPRPSKKHSIDRIDNEKGYEPGNCRWATAIEQASNTRTTSFVTIKGETLARSEAIRRYGFVCRNTVDTRISRGWDPEEAILAPPKNPLHNLLPRKISMS
jgi:hypothetical protein